MRAKPFYLTARVSTEGQTDGQGDFSIPPSLRCGGYKYIEINEIKVLLFTYHYRGQMYPALSLRSKTRRRATLLLPIWICSCQSVGTVNFVPPFTTSVKISISILQTFRSWVATSHLRPPMAFLSHNSFDTPGLAPFMNVLFWGRCDFPISFWSRDMSRNVWNRL